jgi:trk system potassium uptake protein TrkH
MTLFDAICHSFSTVATSGFSTKNLSIAAYDNVWIEVVIMLFMLISSIHFLLIWSTINGKKHNIFSSQPTRMYVVVIFIGTVLITLKLYQENLYGFWESFRYASFQVISLASTTGLATVDSAGWPLFTIIILLYFSIQCGMVGSTTGGIKFDRIYLYFSTLKKHIRQTLHPEGVYVVRINNHIVEQSVEQQISIFIILYILTFSITALLLALFGIEGMTALSASIATLGNVGPGFGSVSSLANYSHLPDAAKYLLSANMLLGRLEIMNILALILMFFRKRDR